MADTDGFPYFPSERYYFRDENWGKTFYYELGPIQRIFVLMTDPNCSRIGHWISTVILMVIILSCVEFIFSTVPAFRHQPTTCPIPACSNVADLCPDREVCEPEQNAAFLVVEKICVTVFTLDYVLRMLTCWAVPRRFFMAIKSPEKEIVGKDIICGANGDFFNFCINLVHHEIGEHCDAAVENGIPLNSPVGIDDGARLHRVDSPSRKRGSIKASVKGSTKPHKIHISTRFMPVEVDVADSQREFEHDTVAEMNPLLKVLVYFMQPLNLVDLLAVLPFYVELIQASTNGKALHVVRVLRLGRIFRIFKLGKNNLGVILLFKVVAKSVSALKYVAFFIFLTMMVLGAVIFFFEQGTFEVSHNFPNGAYVRLPPPGGGPVQSPFTSIPASIYWAVVTSATIGYGDLVPTTIAGRILAIATMYVGVLLISLPITVIGNFFSEEYGKSHKKDFMLTDTIFQLVTIYEDEYQAQLLKEEYTDHSMFKLLRLYTILNSFHGTDRIMLKRVLGNEIRLHTEIVSFYEKQPEHMTVEKMALNMMQKLKKQFKSPQVLEEELKNEKKKNAELMRKRRSNLTKSMSTREYGKKKNGIKNPKKSITIEEMIFKSKQKDVRKKEQASGADADSTGTSKSSLILFGVDGNAVLSDFVSAGREVASSETSTATVGGTSSFDSRDETAATAPAAGGSLASTLISGGTSSPKRLPSAIQASSGAQKLSPKRALSWRTEKIAPAEITGGESGLASRPSGDVSVVAAAAAAAGNKKGRAPSVRVRAPLMSPRASTTVIHRGGRARRGNSTVASAVPTWQAAAMLTSVTDEELGDLYRFLAGIIASESLSMTPSGTLSSPPPGRYDDSTASPPQQQWESQSPRPLLPHPPPRRRKEDSRDSSALGEATATASRAAPHDDVNPWRSETSPTGGQAPSTMEPSASIEPPAVGDADRTDSLFGCNHWLPMPSCPHCVAAVAKRWQADAANVADHASMAAVSTGGATAPSTASAMDGGDFIPPPTRK